MKLNIDKDFEYLKKYGNEALESYFDEVEEELKAKRYLFKVKEKLELVEKWINSKNIIDRNLSLKVTKYYSDKEDDYAITTKLIDINGTELKRNYHIEEYQFLEERFKSFYFTLEYDYHNSEKLKENQEILFKLDDNFVDSFKEYLLNKDLLKLFDYIRLEQEINVNKQNKSKQKI